MNISKAMTLLLFFMVTGSVKAQDIGSPILETFTSHGAKVGVRVFSPPRADDKPRSAIVPEKGSGSFLFCKLNLTPNARALKPKPLRGPA